MNQKDKDLLLLLWMMFTIFLELFTLIHISIFSSENNEYKAFIELGHFVIRITLISVFLLILLNKLESTNQMLRNNKSIGYLFISVLSVWLISPILYIFFNGIYYVLTNSNLLSQFPSNYLNKAAQFGDSFGAINALFSGIAFVSLIYTIRQTKDSLNIQRASLETQIESSREQAFANGFFILFNNYQEEVANYQSQLEFPETRDLRGPGGLYAVIQVLTSLSFQTVTLESQIQFSTIEMNYPQYISIPLSKLKALL